MQPFTFAYLPMVTWIRIRTHHLWRTIKEVGLLSEDQLHQRMTQPVQPLNQAFHLHPNTSLSAGDCRSVLAVGSCPAWVLPTAAQCGAAAVGAVAKP